MAKSKLLIILLIFIISTTFVIAGTEESTFAIAVKQDFRVDWMTDYDFIDNYIPANGYSSTHSLYFDTDKVTTSEIPSVKYVYIKDYEWYNPLFPNNYKADRSPLLIDYCMAVADNPDETVNYKSIDDKGRNIDLMFDVRRGFKEYKSYYEDAGNNPDYHCWEGGWTVMCWVYLDEEYVNNEQVKDHYGWDENNAPNVDDVVDLSITSNCDGEELYCLISAHYPYYIDTGDTFFDGAGDTECIDNIFTRYDIYYVNITQNIYEETEGEVSIGDGTLNNEESNSDDADGNKGGGGSDSGEGETGGYQYLKVQEYLLEKEILTQQLDYLGTVLNIMKLIYSLILLVFYLIEFLIISYLIGTIVPGMFTKLMDIIKKGGRFR